MGVLHASDLFVRPQCLRGAPQLACGERLCKAELVLLGAQSVGVLVLARRVFDL